MVERQSRQHKTEKQAQGKTIIRQEKASDLENGAKQEKILQSTTNKIARHLMTEEEGGEGGGHERNKIEREINQRQTDKKREHKLPCR